MMHSIGDVVRDRRIEASELPEGAKVLVTLLSDDESGFWCNASEKALADVWDDDADDVYAELLEK